MTIDCFELIRSSKDCVARAVGDEYMLLDLQRGTYFGLDQVGALVWPLMEAGTSINDLTDFLHGEFGTERDLLERDLQEFVEQLAESHLIRVETDQEA